MTPRSSLPDAGSAYSIGYRVLGPAPKGYLIVTALGKTFVLGVKS